MTQVATEVFDWAPVGLLSMTGDGRITAANATFVEGAGHERHVVVGSYLLDFLTPGSRLMFEAQVVPTLREHRAVQEMALDMIRADGATVPVLVNARMADDGSVQVAVFSAGSRRSYEASLLSARRAAESAVERVRVLQRAASEFSAVSSREQLAAALIRAARQATDATSASIFVAMGPGGFDEWFENGEHVTVPKTDAPTPQSVTVESGEAVVCPDAAAIASRFPQLEHELATQRVQAFVAIPVELDGRVAGVLLCRFGRPRTLDQPLIELLSAVADQAAVVLRGILLRDQFKQLALHDSLTGLPNRAYSKRRLSAALHAAAEHQRSVAVLFLDLDGFKAINDTLGHDAGDETLRQVGGRLTGVVRAGDVVARLGGDEFLVICDGIDEDGVLALSERVREAVMQPLRGIPKSLALSASIGVSFAPAREMMPTAEQMITVADEAMYESKRGGKNRTTMMECEASR